jgi:hypothetical protein
MRRARSSYARVSSALIPMNVARSRASCCCLLSTVSSKAARGSGWRHLGGRPMWADVFPAVFLALPNTPTPSKIQG